MINNNSSFLGIKRFDLSDNTTVNAGSNNTQTLRPPEGFIYQIIEIECKIPAIGGASGNHFLYFQRPNKNTYNNGSIGGTDGALCGIYYCALYGDTTYPSTASKQENLLTNTWLSNDDYLNFYYVNSSDTNQTGNRELQVYVKVYKEIL